MVCFFLLRKFETCICVLLVKLEVSEFVIECLVCNRLKNYYKIIHVLENINLKDIVWGFADKIIRPVHCLPDHHRVMCCLDYL